ANKVKRARAASHTSRNGARIAFVNVSFSDPIAPAGCVVFSYEVIVATKVPQGTIRASARSRDDAGIPENRRCQRYMRCKIFRRDRGRRCDDAQESHEIHARVTGMTLAHTSASPMSSHALQNTSDREHAVARATEAPTEPSAGSAAERAIE